MCISYSHTLAFILQSWQSDRRYSQYSCRPTYRKGQSLSVKPHPLPPHWTLNRLPLPSTSPLISLVVCQFVSVHLVYHAAALHSNALYTLHSDLDLIPAANKITWAVFLYIISIDRRSLFSILLIVHVHLAFCDLSLSLSLSLSRAYHSACLLVSHDIDILLLAHQGMFNID